MEANPGPHRISRKVKFPILKLSTLNLWQANINGWNQRGWSFIEAAEKQDIHCLVLQETRLQSPTESKDGPCITKQPSIYRRGGLNQSEADEFDTPIAQNISSLGNSSCLLAGDWNHEPLTSPWNVWALSFAGSLSFPTEKKTESQQDGSSQVIHFPAPTRWESNNCIDWGITKGFETQPKLLPDKCTTHHQSQLPRGMQQRRLT